MSLTALAIGIGTALGTAAAAPGTPDRPGPRNIGAELDETQAALGRVAPERFRLTQEFAPRYTRVQTERDTQVRRAALGDVEELLPSVTALQREASPETFRLIDDLVASGRETLDRGGALSPEERRRVQQQSRAAYSARGLALGESAAAAELLDTEEARRRRLEQDRGFALQTAGLGYQTAVNPFETVLGVPTAGYGETAFEQADPLNPYAADAYNTNFNAAEARSISGANNRAALYGAGIGALGRVGGGYLAGRE